MNSKQDSPGSDKLLLVKNTFTKYTKYTKCTKYKTHIIKTP